LNRSGSAVKNDARRWNCVASVREKREMAIFWMSSPSTGRRSFNRSMFQRPCSVL